MVEPFFVRNYMPDSSSCLIIMLKYSLPGKVKTRLAMDLGGEKTSTALFMFCIYPSGHVPKTWQGGPDLLSPGPND
jgi:hypothetical protein